MGKLCRRIIGFLIIAAVFIAQGTPSTNLMYEPEKPKNMDIEWRDLRIKS